MYKFMLRFEQVHTKGTLNGQVTRGKIPFVTIEDARWWAYVVGNTPQPDHRPWVLGMWDISPILGEE